MTARIVGAAVLSALAIFALAFEVAAWPSSGRLDVAATFSGACSMRVTGVGPASAAAGIRAGDVVNLKNADYNSRLILVMQTNSTALVGRAGERVALPVARGGGLSMVSVALGNHDPTLTFGAALFFKVFFLIIGMFALWRGRDLASLFLGIWTLGLLVPLPVAWFAPLDASGRLTGTAVSSFLWTYSPIPLYFIIESLSRGIVPRAAILTARWLLFAFQTPTIFETVVNAVARVSTGCVLLPMRTLNDIGFIAVQLVLVAFFVLSYVAARGEQRQRVHWVFWSFIISRFGVLANLLGRIVGHPLNLYGIEWLTVMVFPAGCAYAILRHKLMDINFVINRAIVYTVLTTAVVGIFLALEAVLQHFEVGRGVSLAVEIALAVGIGLSMNTVHQRAQAAIERILFSRKHRAEAALTNLADEAAFIENSDALLRRVVKEIASSLRAKDVAIYERSDGASRLTCASDGSRLPPDADADDPAFTGLRKSHGEVDLSGLTSGLGPSGYAFPMSVRGRLFGALVCGPREDDEPYAPDERALLRHVAREVAAEIHLIRSRDLAELAQAIASGKISADAARERARELTAISE
jgi:hypothetical protein